MFLNNSFAEMAAILAIAAGIGAVGLKLRQPLIVSFLAVGILAGPSGLKIIESYEKIELLAQIGISLLLFVVGLRLDLHMIKTVGLVAAATGIGQVAFTSAIGFLIAIAMGMPPLAAVYTAVALTFSSTIIIVKLLSDKKEIDSLHGRIAVGFLIVQDIVAILALIALAALGGGTAGKNAGQFYVSQMVWTAVRASIFIAVIAILMKYGLPRILRTLAKSPEILAVFSIAWAVLLAAASEAIGLSKEVGAFVAGVSLATTGYREAIGVRLSSIRDFLLLFFFINLGARLQVDIFQTQILPAVVFSLFVLIGNPLIVMAIMGFMGYRRRTGFMAGLTVAQISEFSLILAAMGEGLGHLDEQTVGLITLVGMLTICASTYMILYSGRLYELLAPYIGLFERKNAHREKQAGEAIITDNIDIILIGLGNYGSEIASHLIKSGKKMLGVDFDPDSLQKWREKGLPAVYGDIGDDSLIEQLPLNRTKWVISTIRDMQLSLSLLKNVRAAGFSGKIAASALDEREAAKLKKNGADAVLMPFQDAAEHASEIFTHSSQLYQADTDWPLLLKEVRLRSGSVFSGKKLGDIPIRSKSGASIVAVGRAAKVHFGINPDFVLYPNDRIVLIGSPEQLEAALNLIEQQQDGQNAPLGSLLLTSAEIGWHCRFCGKTLAQTGLRQDYGITVVGIDRAAERLLMPTPQEIIAAGDKLIVVGSRESIEKFKADLGP